MALCELLLDLVAPAGVTFPWIATQRGRMVTQRGGLRALRTVRSDHATSMTMWEPEHFPGADNVVGSCCGVLQIAQSEC